MAEVITVAFKPCSRCKKIKVAALFPRDRKSANGLYCQCKSCVKDSTKAINADPVRKAKRLASSNKYRISHPDRVAKVMAAYHRNNTQKRANYQRERLSRPNARANLNRWAGQYRKNPRVKLAMNIRGRIYGLIGRGHKSGRSLELLGLSSVDQLINYLEVQFRPGMSWDNYGKWGWHVDHIEPLSQFNLLDESQRKVAFNYTNLQPLWWYENLSKSNRRQS